jgi:DNA polymerase delta subunit 4
LIDRFSDISFSNEKELKLLRAFDLNTKYGNALGLTRLERFERAEKLGLSPPKELGEILRDATRLTKCKTQKEAETFRECLWYAYNDIFK